MLGQQRIDCVLRQQPGAPRRVKEPLLTIAPGKHPDLRNRQFTAKFTVQAGRIRFTSGRRLFSSLPQKRTFRRRSNDALFWYLGTLPSLPLMMRRDRSVDRGLERAKKRA